MASFLLLSKGTRRMSPRGLFPYGPFPGHGGWGSHELDPAWGIGTTEETNTARSKVMEQMTDTLKEGIKDTARGVEKSKKAAVRTAEKVKDTTDRAVEKVKDA